MAFANGGVIEVEDLALRGAALPPLAEDRPAPVMHAVAHVPQAAAEAPSAASPTPALASAQVGASLPEPALPLALADYLDGVECQIIRRALARTRFNRTAAAELLGLSFRQLRYRMQRLDIHEPE